GLPDDRSIDGEHRHLGGGMARAMLLALMFVLQQMYAHSPVGDALQVERDANTIGRRGAPVAVEDGLAHAALPSRAVARPSSCFSFPLCPEARAIPFTYGGIR